MEEEPKSIPLHIAIIPVLFLISALFVTLVVLKEVKVDGEKVKFELTVHIPLIMATAVAAIFAVAYGRPWKDIREGMVHGITLALPAILILMVVGTLIGTWIQGGVVPAMIYYGMKVLLPGIFLPATLIICSIVALGTGSSWSTAATVGVALIGVGRGLGIPDPMVAGAIISGAYFGDKMSPMSDTTNLAPAVAGTDLFSHIRHMIYTTAPSYILALILFSLFGAKFRGGSIDTGNVEVITSTLETNFNINLFLLLPPLLVIAMVVKKIPALPALLGGSIIGAIFALTFQSCHPAEVIQAAHSGFVSKTGVEIVDDLLFEKGGLENMMGTVALIMCALSYGGIMERTGMLETIACALLKWARSRGSLVTTTIFSCIGMNALAADQYLAIVIPGRMYKKAYDDMGLHPKNLSRALEDSGTLSSPLIPWNTCGAYMGEVLGISPFVYLPYAFLNLCNPLISIFYGYTGITMHKLEDNPEKSPSDNQSGKS
ncbi:MAG: sodium:proton antiporter [Phycisphaerae bacterium SM23_30]|nr:MAG: sodium:proton antiporter [Phycisphaerae bacterium SM23_30]